MLSTPGVGIGDAAKQGWETGEGMLSSSIWGTLYDPPHT